MNIDSKSETPEAGLQTQTRRLNSLVHICKPTPAPHLHDVKHLMKRKLSPGSLNFHRFMCMLQMRNDEPCTACRIPKGPKDPIIRYSVLG